MAISLGSHLASTDANVLCLHPIVSTAISLVFLILAMRMIWKYHQDLLAIVRKLDPSAEGAAAYWTIMTRPFLFYSKDARALPEYRRMWRHIALFFVIFVAMAITFLGLSTIACALA